MKRRKNFYLGLGPAPTPSRKERQRQKRIFQGHVREQGRKLQRESRRKRGKQAATLFRQLRGERVREEKSLERARQAQARKGHIFTDKEWREFLKENPKGAGMATKKRKKKKNPKKGVMPAGLRKYWAKKRAKKNSAKKKRAKKRNPAKRRMRRRKPVSTKVKNFRRNPVRKKKRARRRKYNPRPRRMTIKAPSGLGPKGLQQFRRAIARASGMRTRVVKR